MCFITVSNETVTAAKTMDNSSDSETGKCIVFTLIKNKVVN